MEMDTERKFSHNFFFDMLVLSEIFVIENVDLS